MLFCFEQYDFEKPEKCPREIQKLEDCMALHQHDPVGDYFFGYWLESINAPSVLSIVCRTLKTLLASGKMQCPLGYISILYTKERSGDSSNLVVLHSLKVFLLYGCFFRFP